MKKLFILFLGLQMLALSCKKDHQCPQPDVCPDGVEAILQEGGLDGCGWLLKLNDGGYRNPVNLALFDIEVSDGKPVYVNYIDTVIIGRVDICMVQTVKIKCIVERDK